MENNLTLMMDGETITSLELLKQVNHFREMEGNRNQLLHKNFLVVIRDEFEDEITELKIQPSEYKDPTGRSLPMFTLPLKYAKQVLMRESRYVRRAVIEYIEKMEKQLAPKTFKEALLLAVAQQERLEEQQLLLEEQAPKVLFADAIVASKKSCLVGELAKIITQNGIEIGQNRLFKWFKDNNYVGKFGERKNIPHQRYVEQGLFELKKGVRVGNDGVQYNTITTMVTPKGQSYFIQKFLG